MSAKATASIKPDVHHVTLQRAEGAAALLAATVVYFVSGFELLWFVLLFFTIDLFMLGYLVNPRVGAAVYNFGHSYVVPLIGLAVAYLLDDSLVFAFALIWIAHIGLDRVLGYGLKLPTGFHDTHLGKIGNNRQS